MTTNYKSIVLATSLCLALATSISAAPGDLDPTFGNGGKRTDWTGHIDLNNSSDFGGAVALDSQGRAVVVGGSGPVQGSGSMFAIARFLGNPTPSSIPTPTVITTPTPAATPSPLPSPSLRINGKIAFSAATYDNIAGHEHSGISVINPDGSGRFQLTSTQTLCPPPNRTSGCGPDQLDFSPSWSPNGHEIAFIRSVPAPGSGYASDVFVMNADGSNQRQVTQLGQAGFPTWSPDGARLAFTGAPAPGDIFYQIYVVNADGSGLHPIGRGIEPAWSPDGSKLVFLSADGRGFYLMNPDGSGRTQLTKPPADYPCDYGPQVDRCYSYDGTPSWSPDGSKLAFIRYDNCYGDECDIWRIWTVNADGSNPAMLNDKSAYYVGLAWSPDGTKIVFSADNHLFTMEADGSNVTRLTDTPGEVKEWPSWQSVPVVPPNVNPIDDASYFVRQHYLDFLNREADPNGLAYWTSRIAECGSEARCIHERRIGVSAAFFIEQEFQETGYFVYRFYKASFGRQPNYTEFTSDRSKVIGGADLETNKQAFADEWVQRAAFVAAYPNTLSNAEVVNKLFNSAGLTSSGYDAQRQQEIQKLNAGLSRALVLRDVIDIPDFKNSPNPNDPRYTEVKQVSQYNPAFVLMQYYGYLRRNVDQNGYKFWLDIVNNREPNNYHGMVCAFLTSYEYQLRFGATTTHSNADCGQ